MQVGECKECNSTVEISDNSKIPGYEVWECPDCGHPHALDEFWNVRGKAD